MADDANKKHVNISGKDYIVNFDALDNLISEFDGCIKNLSDNHTYVVSTIIELESEFSSDTFSKIKEVLKDYSKSINKILESLSTLNYAIKQSKVYFEKLASEYNASNAKVGENNTSNAKVGENNSLSNNPGETDEKNTTELENIQLKYDEVYNITDDRLTKRKGVVFYDGHKETWYSEKAKPGERLTIPGRHVASDGTIRDADGYIVVASDLSYMSRGTVLMTSLGPAKVYDTGCDYGTIDIYTNWELE